MKQTVNGRIDNRAFRSFKPERDFWIAVEGQTVDLLIERANYLLSRYRIKDGKVEIPFSGTSKADAAISFTRTFAELCMNQECAA